MVSLPRQVEQVATALAQRGWKLATAESCTGGGIAAALTERSGSSAWFERGFVTYSNASKIALLNVQQSTLDKHGAVSEAVAREMAVGALGNSAAQVTLSVTGVAGPDGGTAEKPVGMVCFGWAGPGAACRVETRQLTGDRQQIRLQATIHALSGLLSWLAEHPSSAMQ